MQAETLARNTGAPVLVHRYPKPSYKCVDDVQSYFSNSKTGDKAVLPRSMTIHQRPQATTTTTGLLVVGDRVSTDMILANRLRERIPKTSGILTTVLHARESLGTSLIRRFENWYMRKYALTRSIPVSSGTDPHDAVDLTDCTLASKSDSSSAASVPTSRTRTLEAQAGELWKETQSAWMPAVIDRASPFSRWHALFGKIDDATTSNVRRAGGLVERARWLGAKWQLGLPLRERAKF